MHLFELTSTTRCTPRCCSGARIRTFACGFSDFPSQPNPPRRLVSNAGSCDRWIDWAGLGSCLVLRICDSRYRARACTSTCMPYAQPMRSRARHSQSTKFVLLQFVYYDSSLLARVTRSTWSWRSLCLAQSGTHAHVFTEVQIGERGPASPASQFVFPSTPAATACTCILPQTTRLSFV